MYFFIASLKVQSSTRQVPREIWKFSFEILFVILEKMFKLKSSLAKTCTFNSPTSLVLFSTEMMCSRVCCLPAASWTFPGQCLPLETVTQEQTHPSDYIDRSLPNLFLSILRLLTPQLDWTSSMPHFFVTL